MAHSKKSAGNGIASGSAMHHVPASAAASPEAGKSTPAALSGPDQLSMELGNLSVMLGAIEDLAETVLIDGGGDTHSVCHKAEAIEACVEKAQRALERAYEALKQCPPQRMADGGLQ